MEKDFASIGYYEPGFIHLRVNTDKSLSDINKLKDDPSTIKYYSNFFHEYIHFLQDITTTHGLLNFINAIEHIRNSNKIILQDAKSEFNIPLKQNNHYNLLTNTQLRKIYYGDSAYAEDVAYLSYKSHIEKVVTNIGETLDVDKYIIDYYDNKAQTKMHFHFGSRCIKEYMTHALQNKLFPGTKHAAIPYNIVELIIQKEYPILLNDKSLIIALCDISLMSYHPAQFFFFNIERMKNETEWTPTDVDSIYRFAYDDLTFNHNGQVENVYSLYDKISNDALGCFKDSLAADIFQDNVAWFEEILKEAKTLRFSSLEFFNHLVDSEGILSNKFISILRKMGSPFMTNVLNEGFFMPPEKLLGLDIQPYYPKVFQAIILTYGGYKNCNLYDFCDSRKDKKITNSYCSTSPWLRIKEPEGCPYSLIWHTWGLDNKTPKF